MLTLMIVRRVFMEFFILIILCVFLFDMAKFRKQNEIVIVQNEKIISLLEEMKNK